MGMIYLTANLRGTIVSIWSRVGILVPTFCLTTGFVRNENEQAFPPSRHKEFLLWRLQ